MFDVIEHVLTAAVADNGTFTVSYPANRSAGSYTGAHKHVMFALGAKRTNPDNFTISFGASDFTVTYKDSTTLPVGTLVRIQLDRVGDDNREPEKVALPDTMQRAPVMRIDLGSPDLADADGAAASQSVAAGEEAVLNGVYASNGVVVFDVPRNVVGAWTTTSVITITGTDADGDDVVEQSASGTSHTGSKAFKTITSISSSASITSATFGTGVKLGMPRYISSANRIIAELQDGVVLGRRPGVVYLSGKILEAAVDGATPLNIVSPVAGNIRKLTTICAGAVTTGGAITVEVNTVAVNGLSVTIADSSAEGDVDSDTATAGHATTAVAVGDRIEIIPASAFSGACDLEFVLEIDTTAAGQLDGTFVAGVTTAATATTGDTRGTYSPSTAPSGAIAYELWAIVPDPSNKGVAQYDG